MSDVPPPPPPPPPPPSYSAGPPGSSGPDIGAALSYGWNKFTANVGALIAIILAPLIVVVVLQIIGILVIRGFVGFLLFFALALLIASVAYIGIFNAALMATSGQRVDFGKAFHSDRWGEWIAFSLLYGLMLAVGYALCLIGALFVIAFWGLAPFYFLDQGMKPTQALSAAFEKSRSTPGLPIALGVLALVGWAGGLVCIGGLITYPVAIIGAAFLYRGATNQVAAP